MMLYMATLERLPSAALVVREHHGQAFYEAKFRDGGQQVKRRVGPAWLDRAGDGAWKKRRGRVEDGFFDERAAHVRAAELVRQYVANAADAERAERERKAAGLTFRELSARYLSWLERVRGAKPSTLADHRILLAEPGTAHKRGDGQAPGHIMAALGGKPARKISADDVKALLDTLADTGVAPRTVNKTRNLVGAIFAYGVAERGLSGNPVVGIARRREPASAPLVYYQPEEIEAVARALADGLHRQVQEHHERGCSSRLDGWCNCSPSFQAAGVRFADREEASAYLRASRTAVEIAEDQQDAEAVRIAAYAGLRLGELLTLRWADVDWSGSVLTISRALSAGEERSTKSGRVRRVPLADQAAAALEQLSRRENFTEPDDLVFPNAIGRTLDSSALRRRFKRARDATGLRPLRWHDLRHTFGSLLVAGGVDLVSVKDALGHSQLATTSRYLHARPATERAALFTAAFAVRNVDTPPNASEVARVRR
jgi:integrase